MKCQNCGQVLPGAAVICRNCNFNNALQALDDWRHKRQQNVRGTTSSQRPAIRRNTDATLIQFPASTQRTSASPEATRADASRITADLTSEQAQPHWREQLNEKLRQIREQREAETASPASAKPAQSDVNPIVEAAIRRLRQPQKVSAPVSSSGGQAVARALQYEEEPAPVISEAPQKPATHRAEMPPVTVRPALSGATAKAVPVTPPQTPQTTATEASSQIPSPVETLPIISKGATETVIAAPAATQETDVVPVPLVRTEKAFSAFTSTEEKYVVIEDDEPAHEESPSGENNMPAVTATSQATAEWAAAMAGLNHSSGRAPLLARIAAGIIDLEIIAFSCLPFFTAFTLFNVEFNFGAVLLLMGLMALMAFAYYYITIAQAGRTCGMAIFRLRVANAADENSTPDKGQCLRRAFGSVLSLALIPLNLLIVAFSTERRSLADQISGSLTIRQ